MSRSLMDEIGPHDLGVRDLGFGAVRGGDCHALLTGGEDLPTQLPAGGANFDAVSLGGCEVLLAAQRPVESRRRHLDAVVAEVVAQEVGDPRAERVVYAVRVVD